MRTFSTPPNGAAATCTSSRTSPTAPRSIPNRIDSTVPFPACSGSFAENGISGSCAVPVASARQWNFWKLRGSRCQRAAHEPPSRCDRSAPEYPLFIDDLQRDRRSAVDRYRRKLIKFRQSDCVRHPVRTERRAVDLCKIDESPALPCVDKMDFFRSGASLHLRYHRCRNDRNSLGQRIRIEPRCLNPEQRLEIFSVPQLRTAESISDVHHDSQEQPHRKGRNSGRSPKVPSNSLIRCA